jgi:uncharacterized protein HemX
MSEFPEIQPFGPRPASHNEEPPSEPRADAPAQPPTQPAAHAQQSHLNLTAAILTAVGLGFALGYLVSRYQQLILRQSRLDEFLNYAQAWIREQGPKIAEPIRQGLESTGSTVEHAFKKVSAGHSFGSLNPFHHPKPRKFLGFLG